MIVALALGLALGIQAWLIKPYQIPSGSMEPTLEIGQRVLVNRFLYHFTDPSVGDIIVFHPPTGADAGGVCGAPHPSAEPCPEPTKGESSQNFIKRLVAGPGDRVRIINGQAIVNGQVSSAANGEAETNCGTPLPRSEWSHAQADSRCTFPKEIVVPPDHYFMMGDNRANSEDSRFWGPVPRDWIIGKAFATYWPPDRAGIF